MHLDLERMIKTKKSISILVDKSVQPGGMSKAELQRLIKVCGFGVERDETLRYSLSRSKSESSLCTE
jgi:hypothetical protein